MRPIKMMMFKNALLAWFLLTALASPPSALAAQSATAVFAGGCFWCMQPPYDKLKEAGVSGTTVGYAGGQKDEPTYEQVSSGTTGHREAIRVDYDPAKISYEKLLDTFWANIDPLDARGQFCDKGIQYTSAIFYSNDEQKKAAEASLDRLAKSGKLHGTIATVILPLPGGKFFPAEDYHQSYYSKNPLRYRFYRGSCGRDNRLKEVWGKSDHSIESTP